MPHLCHLRCRSAVIAANADMDTLATSPSASHVPDVMTTLTRLTHLQMQVDLSPSLAPRAELDLSWLSHLTSLRKLELTSDYAYTLPPGISQCSSLEDLRLTFYSYQAMSKVDVDWTALCNLKHLHLMGALCFLGHSLLRLVKTLSEVHVDLGASFEWNCETLIVVKEAVKIRAPWIRLHFYQELQPV